MRRWMRARPADVIDVFVSVVVLNLAVDYVPSMISEGFTTVAAVALLVVALLASRAGVRSLLEEDPT